MLKHLIVAAIAVITTGMSALAEVAPGQPAPDFTVMTSSGESIALSQFRGKTVILEWTNHDCPYVKKHYTSGTMQSLQRDATADGAVWISVISSAPGLQGHVDAAAANTLTASRGAYPSYVAMDPSGEVGLLYGAKTTPHMFVIDGAGVLQYMGGIDDKNSSRASSLDGAFNYVGAALAEMAKGQPVSISSARPYGCSVKYAG